MQLNPGTKLAKSETVQKRFGSAAPILGFSMTYFVSLMNLLPEFHAHVNKINQFYVQFITRMFIDISDFGQPFQFSKIAFVLHMVKNRAAQ